MTDDAEPTTPKKKARISIDMPKELKPAYANMAFIGNTPAEMVIDFALVLPRTPRGAVVSRVIMSPMHAKMLQFALAQNIANYERQFGEIKIPVNQQNQLAKDFFRFPQDENDDDNE